VQVRCNLFERAFEQTTQRCIGNQQGFQAHGQTRIAGTHFDHALRALLRI